ncbi:PREDICTED: glutamate-gated chloride channel isoform X6 [Eufriesea mexicana]|uniref:glutamate-gated chloride channel isoform X6 n=1 Tax=Eufriesea mexicana TaxID=516756 RepID=UPI00083C8583|nr:PREDICTED: glutamate-gated chloride channel isoform X6 [Eufriesea mexicana]
MGWVALGRCAGGGGRLSSVLSLSLTSLASSLIFTILCILTLALTLVTLVRAEDIFEEGKSDKEILDNLLLSTRYDKRLLPPVQGTLRPPPHTRQDDYTPDYLVPNDPDHPEHLEHHRHRYHHTAPHNHSSLLTPRQKGTLTVNVSVLLLSLASPDESSLKYEVEFLLQQQWYDPRLRYSNRSQYEFLNAIHHYNDIWLPDTYFIMHGDFKDPLIPVHFALRIYRNGTVNYLMRRHLILSCQGRLNIFPFDDPLCSFAIESISYEQTAITYVWKNDEGTLRKSPSLTSLNAYLIKNQTITCPIKVSWRGNYSCLKVDLIFTRDRAFYFTTVFIPGIILVTSSFITFWLEWNAVPARVMIGVTTMLNFFTTSNGFRSTLPVVSNLTAMNVWDGVCMCFIYASLLEFVCVNYVGRKRPMHNVVYRPGENPVTQRLPAVLSRIGIILASPLKREGGPPTGATTGPNEIVTCTNCGPNPCTHTATNGCTAELRKKEPPHPIRVAKTIDVIARITFPVAYFMFLTFFFIHYKGTS